MEVFLKRSLAFAIQAQPFSLLPKAIKIQIQGQKFCHNFAING